MHKLLLSFFTTAALLGAQAAWAGGMEAPPAEPMVEPEIPTEAGSLGSMGSGGWLVPLLLIGVIAYVVSQDDEPAAAPSDVRIKTDIYRVGTAENGLPLYRFSYVWSDIVYTGVMAQDVEKFMPDAVINGLFGVKFVNYEMLGLEMATLG